MIASLLLLIPSTPPAHAQSHPDFSGTWKQDGVHSVPARSGDVTLRIDQHDPELSIETTILRPSCPQQHAVQRYTTDNRESVSTGADGDSFRTKIVWQGQSLVFTIVESEDGRTLESTETWTLIDGGSTLKRLRRGSKIQGEQVILYARTPGM